ncbi:OmpH family outer membrane protein [Algoriphagus zhangzhouensis]|uniref:Periplasmic chaperone for outer membrane proteins Skp n=1 Tax=Algoriphagus zhangzhouensis TaxID=1073327 RepID=A0A1M7ZFM1_9BACT|nr:OmpH family outer membrane protein [Algoriphagus zhangzhouensis]TDY45004.1 periplasmic chaperone for outer membrane proteins Skp [Algoriphagus zhangzhouensis]SHO63705.1 periplasmic chaperone for outer membrane proteins Skp [Algoriphagus zhangzhouensis]
MNNSPKIVLLFLFMLISGTLTAQKFGYIDSEYILNKHPDYKIVQQELENLSDAWKKEAQSLDKEIKDMYTQLKAEEVLLTEEMYQSRLQDINKKEQASREFNSRIFGIEGQYFQKQAELLQPLQSKIYDAIERVSRKNNLAMLFDKASVPSGIIYTDPRHDYSEFVLDELGIEDNN